MKTFAFPHVTNTTVQAITGTSRTISSDTTMVMSDLGTLILVDATAGPVTYTLLDPTTAGNTFWVEVQKTDASANAAVIVGGGAIIGEASIELLRQYETRRFRSTGTQWTIVAEAQRFVSLASFAARADAAAARIAEDVEIIETFGYATGGDGGEAHYKRVVAEPAHEGKFQSTDGAWWEIAEDVLYADQFGAVRGEGQDAGTREDNLAAMQAMNDAIVVHGYVGTANLRAGVYEYTGTLKLGRGDAFRKITLKGQGRVYRGDADSNAGTTLLHFGPITHQAINVQGARYGQLEGFTLIGMLDTDISELFNAHLTDKSPLVDAAVFTALGGDDRYSPYAGITLDAFAGSTPASPYPDATYSQASSSAVDMQDLEIAGFNTGFVNVPAATDAQGDFTSMRNVRIENCMYAFSVGNTQSRNIDISIFHYLQCHTVFTNNKHGMQNGRYGGLIKQVSGGRATYLFDFTLGRTFSGVVFESFYAEVQYALGKGGSGVGGSGVTFRGGAISFENPGADYGQATYAIEGTTSCPILFDDFAITSYAAAIHFQPRNIHFINGCLLQSRYSITPGDLNLYKAFAHNATAGIVSDPLYIRDHDQEYQFSPRNVQTGAPVAIQLTNGPAFQTTDRIYCCPIYVSRPGRSPAAYYKRPIERPRLYSVKTKASFGSVDLTDYTLTLTIASTTWMTASRDGHFPGDIIRDANSGSIFWIASYAGPAAADPAGAVTIVAYLQNNMKPDNSLYSAFSTSVGNLEFINCRVYAQSDSTLGDTTSGSAIITNVGNEAGSFAYGTVAVGDALPVASVRGLFASINRVIAVDTGARTITMSSNALKTSTREDFTWWARF
jgi:hypothetical protein